MILEKENVVLLVCLIAILLISLFGVGVLLSNRRLHGEEYRALAVQRLEEARGEFERIRGVSLREVALEVVNTSWVIEHWGRGYSDPEIDNIVRMEKIYKALFVISQDVSLYDASLEWTGLFTAAKWQGKIYVVEENFNPLKEQDAKATFVHELTHVLQEGYSMPERPGTFDGDKARTSLTEGDANLMADTFRGEGVSLIVSSITLDEEILSVPVVVVFSGEVQPSLPDTIGDLNRFPYRYGVDFVKELYERGGGWEAVGEAYENPPNTTEQIMHPEKYFAQEDAQPVEAPLLGGGWDLTKSERLGEYSICVMLDNWISKGEAEVAAEGWGGDNLTFYEKGDEYVFLWNIVWDCEDDAHEFCLAFQEMMDKTSAEKESGGYWFADGRYISVQCNGDLTLIVSSGNETMVQQSFFE